MSEPNADDLLLEPERYELQVERDAQWAAARDEFFRCVGGGIVVVYALDQAPALTGAGRRGGPGVSLPQEIGVWLHVAEDGSVTGYTGKAEVGQGIRTMLTQVIADELSVPAASIRMVMGDTDLSPFDGGTAGSRTTPVVMPQVRKAAAAARELLLDLAAHRLGADRESLSLRDGIVSRAGQAVGVTVAALAEGMREFRVVGEDFPGKPPEAWSAPGPEFRVNAHALVTGSHRYTSDRTRPGMQYGKVLRPPARNARRLSLDTRAARQLPGVAVVVDGDFVGVVAPSEHRAQQALSAIRAEWEVGEGQPDQDTIFDYLRAHPAEVQGFGGPSVHVAGSVEEGMTAADTTLACTYTVAYIAHAPLEPRAAVAEWEADGRLTVWAGTQRPFGVRAELAEALGVGEDRIRVQMPDTGSGYGGKHTGEAAVEAARLARGAGVPVKLVWTREEEFAWAYFRPAGVIDIRSGVNTDGAIVAWEHHNYNSGGAAIRPLYDIPNQHGEFHPSQSPLRQGSYRALAATANHFARESHMDELAHAVGRDPLAFRRQNLTDIRLLAVLEAAAARFGWGATPTPGHGYGIAGGHEKGSYVATCAEVAVDPESGAVRVVRAVTAFECGAIVNPDNVRNQVEGAVIMGLGGALFEDIRFDNGVVRNGRFSEYRLPRFTDIPLLETVLLDRKDLPAVGAGETPIVAIAPAIANAVFHAMGVRLRSLPLRMESAASA